MTTAVIQIGNSDNKLTQIEWSQFVSSVRDIIVPLSKAIHFDGGSKHDAPWQNACIVAEVASANREALVSRLRGCKEHFRQDSIAVTFGETAFV
jgi:hypothetical protein